MSEQSASATAHLDTVIWCDFGGVLSAGLGHGYERVAHAVGVPWGSIVEAAVTVAESVGLSGFQPLELGAMSQSDWGDSIADTLGVDGAERTALREFDRHYYRARTLDDELLAGLQVFRGRGAALGMLTNSVLEWEPHRDVLLAGTPAFDHYLRSHEVGLAKPDPAIYELADTLLGSAGARRILIDDLEVNCAAAERHGWSAVLHTDTPSTIAALQALVM